MCVGKGLYLVMALGYCQGSTFGIHGTSFKYNDSNSSMDDKTYFILAYAWKELIALFNIDSCKCNDSKSCTQSPISYINDKTHFMLAYGWKSQLHYYHTWIQWFKFLHSNFYMNGKIHYGFAYRWRNHLHHCLQINMNFGQLMFIIAL